LFTAVRRVFKRISFAHIESLQKIGCQPRQISVSEFNQSIISLVHSIEVPALTPNLCLLREVDSAVYFPQLGQSASLWITPVFFWFTSLEENVLSLRKELPFRGSETINVGWLQEAKIANVLLACLGNSGQL
jgi:hypothetical protein